MAGLGVTIGLFFSWAGNTNLVIHPWIGLVGAIVAMVLLDSDEGVRMYAGQLGRVVGASISGSANPSSV